MKPMTALHLARAVLSARRQLRGATMGPRTRVEGRVVCRPSGTISLGDRVRFDAEVAAIEIGAGTEGHLEIGDNCYINYGTSIAAMQHVQIGRDCLIGTYVMIVDNDFHRLEPDRRLEAPDSAPVTIGDNVWIGGHSIVLKGVTIGDNSVIAAGSLVTKDVPPDVVYGGNPARHLRDL